MDDQLFELTIEQVLEVTGRGTFMAGNIGAGTVRIGDRVLLLGGPDAPRDLTVTAIEFADSPSRGPGVTRVVIGVAEKLPSGVGSGWRLRGANFAK